MARGSQLHKTRVIYNQKEKHHLVGNAVPAGYCHAHMLIYECEVNNDLNSNHTKYLAELCGRFFCVLENFSRKFANLVAPPTNATTKRLRHPAGNDIHLLATDQSQYCNTVFH